jgi:hypothetical protein
VLLRLITERGRPSVKISTSEEASAVGLAGPTSTRNTYVLLQAKGNASSLKVKNEDGREQIVKPWRPTTPASIRETIGRMFLPRADRGR